MEESFQNVERVLSNFPKEARENYEKNKKSVKKQFVSDLDKGIGVIVGNYNPLKNEIKLVEGSSLEHELIHMAFSNREMYQKEIANGIYLENGVAFRKKDKPNWIYGKRLTEGFAESLNRKSKRQKEGTGHPFETYIVELLISIYGEELYLFPLNNDPIGFYNYCSDYILDIRDYLDIVCYTEDNLVILSQLIEKKEIDITDELAKDFYKSEELFLVSFIEVMKAILNEYCSCKFPHITKEQFKEEIEKIFYSDNVTFLLASHMVESAGKDLQKEIEILIDQELFKKQNSNKRIKQIKKYGSNIDIS